MQILALVLTSALPIPDTVRFTLILCFSYRCLVAPLRGAIGGHNLYLFIYVIKKNPNWGNTWGNTYVQDMHNSNMT